MDHSVVGVVGIGGRNAEIVERLAAPIRQALMGRGTLYEVTVDPVGRVGEILVSVTGFRGHVPLLFSSDELEPAYVSSVVERAVAKFNL